MHEDEQVTQFFSNHYHQCHPQKELARLIDVTGGRVNLWEHKGVVPGAIDQWIFPLTHGRLDGHAGVPAVIGSAQTVPKLSHQKYLGRELDLQLDVVVLRARAASTPHAWGVAAT